MFCKTIKLKFVWSIFILTMISCTGWASKEKSEFIQECKGSSEKKEDIDFCNCVFEALSDKFTYSEYKQISVKAHSEFTLNEDEKLKDITPKIIDCY